MEVSHPMKEVCHTLEALLKWYKNRMGSWEVPGSSPIVETKEQRRNSIGGPNK